MGWPFPVLKYKCIFQIKYAEAVLSNSTRKLLWSEITKMLIAVRNKFNALFIIIFGTVSLLVTRPRDGTGSGMADGHTDPKCGVVISVILARKNEHFQP